MATLDHGGRRLLPELLLDAKAHVAKYGILVEKHFVCYSASLGRIALDEAVL